MRPAANRETTTVSFAGFERVRARRSLPWTARTRRFEIAGAVVATT
jgi:hypothetical protein